MNKVRPFYCGTQCADWRISNCERCKKFDYDNPKCEIDIAIAQAQFGDGTFTPEMAKRMGWTNDCKEYIWMCSEVEWTDEWKERARRYYLPQMRESLRKRTGSEFDN